MEFLVTDGETFAHEEKRDLLRPSNTSTGSPGVRYVNRDPDGRYSLTKEIICDPHHSVVLTNVRLEDILNCCRGSAYMRSWPHLDGGGAGNTARAVDMPATRCCWVEEPLVVGHGIQLRLRARQLRLCRSERRWRDVMEHFGMEWSSVRPPRQSRADRQIILRLPAKMGA